MTNRASTQAASRHTPRTAYLLTRAHFALRIEVDHALKKFDMTGLQFTVLSLVSRHPGLSSAGLARRFYRTQQAMGQLLIGLEEKGWLIRSEYPENRRMLMVTLTDAGHKLVAAGEVALNKVEVSTFSSFNEKEMEVFHRVLETVERIVTKSEKAAP